MKIIQIIGGGCDQEGNEAGVFGLGDDGNLYEFCNELKPRIESKYIPDPEKPGSYKMEGSHYLTTLIYHDGFSRGWRLVATSDVRSKPITHPEDPTRHERS